MVICTRACFVAVILLAVGSPQDAAASGVSAEPVYNVVCPLGESAARPAAMASRLDTLAGKTVCMVWNHSFKADVTLPAIAEALKKQYPSIRIVPHHAMPIAPLPEPAAVPGKESEALQAAFKAKSCDAVIAGNGGWGICTPRACHATVLAEQLGIPAVVVTNPGFDDQARKMARGAGIPSLQVAVYPDPFDLETDSQLQQKSATILVPQIIDALTKPIAASKGVAEKRDSREILFTGTIDQINRHFTENFTNFF